MNLESRVRRAILRHELVRPGERLVVAVSGGPDSVALLHLLHRIAPGLGVELAVAHLDHGLRGTEGEADAGFVLDLAASLGLPCTHRKAPEGDIAGAHGLSIEMAAREARYRFLADAARDLGASAVATAHTADDLAETVLLFLLRGSGTRGLGGFGWTRGLAEGVRLVRPLRETPRAEIAAFLAEGGIPSRHDRTNDDPAHLRNRLRRELLPLVRDRFNPGIVEALVRTADRWTEADDYFEAEAGRALPGTLTTVEPGKVTLDAARLLGYHGALHGRVLRAASTLIISRPLSDFHTGALVRLARGEGGAVDLPGGARAFRRDNRIIIQADSYRPADRVRAADEPPVPLPVPGRTSLARNAGSRESFLQATLEEGSLSGPPLGSPAGRVVLDWGALAPPLVVRHPRAGDRIRPLGLGGSRKLQDILVDRKVPREDRPALWVVEDQERILWVVGIVMSEEARVTGSTTRRLVLEAIEGIEEIGA